MMEEDIFGGPNSPSYGVVQAPGGRILIRVYHENEGVLKRIRTNARSSRYFLDWNPDSGTMAVKWLARAVAKYRTYFEQGKVDFEIVADRDESTGPRPGGKSVVSPERPEKAGDSSTSEIETLGFVQVGEWTLDSILKNGLRFTLSAMATERTIYGFASNGILKYIGVCDARTTTLKKRMSNYQAMAGGSTSERVPNHILQCLDRKEKVTIWAWKPVDVLEVNGLQVDIVKGLENPLIAKFRPEWNIKS
jgi:hypothetical protein